MADTSFLDWPFLEDHHRTLARELDAWAAEHIAPLAHDHGDVDATCGVLVRRLGEGGWLRYCVPAAYGGIFDELDSRSLCLMRQTLGYYDGLADFAFVMQGLGSGAISLEGSEAQRRHWLHRVQAARH